MIGFGKKLFTNSGTIEEGRTLISAVSSKLDIEILIRQKNVLWCLWELQEKRNTGDRNALQWKDSSRQNVATVLKLSQSLLHWWRDIKFGLCKMLLISFSYSTILIYFIFRSRTIGGTVKRLYCSILQHNTIQVIIVSVLH